MDTLLNQELERLRKVVKEYANVSVLRKHGQGWETITLARRLEELEKEQLKETT